MCEQEEKQGIPKPKPRPIDVLIPLIQKELVGADTVDLNHYRRAGELLWELKLSAKRAGDAWRWTSWLDEHFKITEKTADRWMALAPESSFCPLRKEILKDAKKRRAPYSQPPSTETPGGSTHPRPFPNPRPASFDRSQPVNALDAEKLLRDYDAKEKEDQLKRELALEIINTGYKAHATRLHPDKGGSTEAMIRLTEVRDTLNKSAFATWPWPHRWIRGRWRAVKLTNN